MADREYSRLNMALKFPKAFGRAAATMSPSRRKKLFGQSIDYDRIYRDSFNEGLIEGLDANKAVDRGLPESVANGRLTWQSLSDDADRAIEREAERRFSNDRKVKQWKMRTLPNYLESWKTLGGEYKDSVINDLRNKQVDIQDLLDVVNNQWFPK